MTHAENFEYVCVVEKFDNTYSASSPDLPVFATGRNELDALRGLAESLHAYSKHSQLPAPVTELSDLRRKYEDYKNLTVTTVKPAQDDSVSKLLEEMFEAESVTHSTVAKRLNVSRAAVSRLANPYYHGHSVDSLRRVADVLGYELVVSFAKKTNS